LEQWIARFYVCHATSWTKGCRCASTRHCWRTLLFCAARPFQGHPPDDEDEARLYLAKRLREVREAIVHGDEQRLFFDELASHLVPIAEFGVNTGARGEERRTGDHGIQRGGDRESERDSVPIRLSCQAALDQQLNRNHHKGCSMRTVARDVRFHLWELHVEGYCRVVIDRIRRAMKCRRIGPSQEAGDRCTETIRAFRTDSCTLPLPSCHLSRCANDNDWVCPSDPQEDSTVIERRQYRKENRQIENGIGERGCGRARNE
jgi:hypothetical protein